MSDFSIELASSIDKIDSVDWDELCARRNFVNHRWQRLVESVVLDYQPTYVLARRDGSLEAAMVCSFARHFTNVSLERRFGWMLSALPFVRCIVPLAARPGLLIAPREGASEAVPELLTAVRRQALRGRAPLISCGEFLADDSSWSALREAGFHQHGENAVMTLPIKWTSLAEYIASLRSHDRRKMGKKIRRAEREGIQVSPLPSPLDHAGLLRRLMAAVLATHCTFDMYVPDLLERAHAVYADDLHVFAAWRSGEIIGCICALRDGDAVLAKWMGLDYSRTWGTTTYRMLLLATVQLAIELGVRELVLGPTVRDTKEDFGAIPEVRFNALAVVPPVPGCLVSATTRFVARQAANSSGGLIERVESEAVG